MSDKTCIERGKERAIRHAKRNYKTVYVHTEHSGCDRMRLPTYPVNGDTIILNHIPHLVSRREFVPAKFGIVQLHVYLIG